MSIPGVIVALITLGTLLYKGVRLVIERRCAKAEAKERQRRRRGSVTVPRGHIGAGPDDPWAGVHATGYGRTVVDNMRSRGISPAEYVRRRFS